MASARALTSPAHLRPVPAAHRTGVRHQLPVGQPPSVDKVIDDLEVADVLGEEAPLTQRRRCRAELGNGTTGDRHGEDLAGLGPEEGETFT